MLIKTGAEVLVCVRRAIGGADLGQLRRAVEQEFLEPRSSARNRYARRLRSWRVASSAASLELQRA